MKIRGEWLKCVGRNEDRSSKFLRFETTMSQSQKSRPNLAFLLPVEIRGGIAEMSQ